MKIPKGGIAVFDSGIGGLTVLSACRNALPQENFYYFGDNRRAPYGNLPVKKIKRYVFRAFKKLKRYKPKAAVLACNTVTALCVEELRKKYGFPIIGTEPALFPAAARGGEVFVLSTRATYESARFRKLLRRASENYPETKIFAYACDGLAGEIEKNLLEGKIDGERYLPHGRPRTVVLGCTHYVYIAEQIRRYYGCKVVDGNDGVAARLQWWVERERNARSRLDHLRPLSRLFLRFRPPTTTENLMENVSAEGKRKIRGGRSAQKRVREKEKKGGIFFLGGGKVVNKPIFEQMFVYKVVGKG